ncbi:OsmC family protein [Amycolatopsis sp. EV170708-02-1]|uniref:OsmC family protein n=1 Tax=Amycolatopsis sp. EV170708-02-1 TaxID=2919322 RepID=UPI001F0C7ED2|nr:OsmC family protein [Amycolatopsis sp. EV170708-02-1]UMO99963.1 OsmC family protein [Amycolatopsis sp. EV170708-02-1]
MAELSVTLEPLVDTVISGHARTHDITVDRPAEKGGTDKGPMGGELLLLALGGCFLSTLIGIVKAEESSLDLTQVNVRVIGSLETAPSRFARILVAVSAPQRFQDQLAKPLLKAERACIVHNSIKNAVDVVFEQHWTPSV